MTVTTSFDVRPMAGHIGVELHGVDVLALDDAGIARIRELWLRHHVVAIRGQTHLSADDLSAFALRFGPYYRHPFYDAEMGLHPLNIPAGGYWHSDVTYAEQPPAGTLLHALALPPAGGDTMWANMALAFDELSPPMQRFLTGLSATHDFDHFFRYPMGDSLETDRFVLDQKAKFALPSHPIVRTHPETGRQALYVNESFTRRVDGVSRAESDALLGFLFQHCVRPEFTCRHRWSVGDICFWDNRATMHYPIDDWGGSISEFENSARRMNRVMIDAQPVA